MDFTTVSTLFHFNSLIGINTCLIAQVIAVVHIVYLGFMNISMEVLQSKRLVQFGFLDICSISKICPPEEHGTQVLLLKDGP